MDTTMNHFGVVFQPVFDELYFCYHINDANTLYNSVFLFTPTFLETANDLAALRLRADHAVY